MASFNLTPRGEEKYIQHWLNSKIALHSQLPRPRTTTKQYKTKNKKQEPFPSNFVTFSLERVQVHYVKKILLPHFTIKK